jgi:hypothetical protein
LSSSQPRSSLGGFSDNIIIIFIYYYSCIGVVDDVQNPASGGLVNDDTAAWSRGGVSSNGPENWNKDEQELCSRSANGYPEKTKWSPIAG